MFSFVGDTVLDPFLGSGTTSLAAKNLSRNSIGYEINSDFLPYIIDKVGIDIKNKQYTIITQPKNYIREFKQKIQNLPYIFKDPIKFDKKIDPRKQKYGSKITLTDTPSDNNKQFYSIKQILSPNLVTLNNGSKVQLLGILPVEYKKQQAINFLRKKTTGQKVYLSFDKSVNNIKGVLQAYLYLKNKTFLNLHLIKNNLVKVDESIDYRYKSRFLEVMLMEKKSA